MKFNYAAHAGPDAACVNPHHACRISNTHLNIPPTTPQLPPPSKPPQPEAQGKRWANCFPLRKWTRLTICGRKAGHTTLIKA